MKPLLLLVALPVLGAAIGAGAGFALNPPEPELHDCPEPAAPVVAEVPKDTEYAKLANQFVVPVLQGGRVEAMVVLSLSLEVDAGEEANIYNHEPKLRDAFNDVLFAHANAGGFSGVFTEPTKMNRLRIALEEAGNTLIGAPFRGVLIDSIMRQDS